MLSSIVDGYVKLHVVSNYTNMCEDVTGDRFDPGFSKMFHCRLVY